VALPDTVPETGGDPVFVLAAPRSFSSVISTVIGQHPELYGLPELELFGAETVAGWWRLCAEATFPRSHGLLRAVAELCFGGQTEETIKQARGWLRRRGHFTTGYLLETLAELVRPRRLVEKSTTNLYQMEFMQRAYRMFPEAKFIHLVRHPRSQGESVLKFLRLREESGPVTADHWLRRLAAFPGPQQDASAAQEAGSPASDVDPQRAWLALNENVCKFLAGVPEAQWIRIRGEDILSEPGRHLSELCRWLGVDDGAEAVEQMTHPELSPYARLGPTGARFGNDRLFLENPTLRPRMNRDDGNGIQLGLESPVPWGREGSGFSAETQRLARQFGYG
jgi:hypothetical protein